MKGFKHLLSISELSREQIDGLVGLASQLKADKLALCEKQHLTGKNIVLLFAKDSTRTRCSFEVAAADQGARTTYIGAAGSQMGSKESVRDTARVLGRMYDGIEYRGFGQSIVEDLAAWSGVPVWNGLTTECHPTQFLADLLTMREHSSKPDKELKVCFLGTADNNVAMSLMVGCARMGIEYSVAAPKQYFPSGDVVARLREQGASIMLSEDVAEAVSGADFLYTDVWVSMGEDKAVWERRLDELMPYQVNASVMAMTGNLDTKFMHCLPAFHNTDTEMGAFIAQQYGVTEMEVSDDVFESSASIVFDQAENRMHTIKAVMVSSFSNN